MKYEIKVTQINDDGSREPFSFDESGKTTAICIDGFAIIGVEEDGGSACAIHNTDLMSLACAIADNENLLRAARLGVSLLRIMKGEADAAD